MLDLEATTASIEIQQTLQRYAHALDRKDYDLLDAVFVPGAQCRYELENGSSELTYPDLRQIFQTFLEPFYFTQHLLGQPYIEIKVDRAEATTSLRAIHVQLDQQDEQSEWTVYGFYQDQFEKRPEGWRIAQRLFQTLHTTGEMLPRDQAQLFPTPTWIRNRT